MMTTVNHQCMIFRVGSVESPAIAIECVRAIDSPALETWNMGPAKSPFEWGHFLEGDWNILIGRYARIKPLESKLPSLLKELESRTIYDVSVNYDLERQDKRLYDLFTQLKVIDCLCFQVQGSGKVKLQTEIYKGDFEDKGSGISKWLTQFLNHDRQKDILFKLMKSNAKQKHVFIMVYLEGASPLIDSYLTHRIEFLPSEVPILPKPIDAVWIMHSLAREEILEGIFWDGRTWHIFTVPKTDLRSS